MRLKREERLKKISPGAKAEKDRLKAEEKAEKDRLKAEEKAEKDRLKAEEKIKKSSPEYIAEEKARKDEEKARKAAEEKSKKETAKLKAQETSAERKKQASKKAKQLELYGETEEGKSMQININTNSDEIDKLETKITEIKNISRKISPENQFVINSKKEEITKLKEAIETLETEFENNAVSIEIDTSSGGNNKTKSNKRTFW